MTVVVDSGIWISALRFGGTPADALDRCIELGDIAFCDEIEREILEVLFRKFAMDAGTVRDRIAPFLRHAVHVAITREVSGICQDSHDDCILECALKAGAQFIITGDKDLLTLREFRGIRILTARQYLELSPKE